MVVLSCVVSCIHCLYLCTFVFVEIFSVDATYSTYIRRPNQTVPTEMVQWNGWDRRNETRPNEHIGGRERERAKEIHCSVLYAHREFYTKAVYCCTTTFFFPLTFSLLKNRVGVVGILVFISHFIFSHTTQFGLPNSSISVEPWIGCAQSLET